MLWSCANPVLNRDGSRRFSPRREGAPVAYADVLRLWQQDESFRSFFIALLRDSELSSFRWETPPVTKATIDRDFEFVLLDAPGLDRRVDAKAFAEHFRSIVSDDGVVTFPNLGNDAYGHLASFIRKAPDTQKHALWRAVGAAMEARVSKKPLWLSTAGMGVSWLHVRLDSRPKYYGFDEYRTR
jgi:hypothetical protein